MHSLYNGEGGFDLFRRETVFLAATLTLGWAPSARGDELHQVAPLLHEVTRTAQPGQRFCPDCQGALQGRTLPFDLTSVRDDALVGPGGTAKLYALGDRPQDVRPDREPLILVHGVGGSPGDLQALVNRFRGSRYQIYVLAYDSVGTRVSTNGETFASELRWLRHNVIGDKKDLTVVGHSMGAIVSRHALNVLTRDHQDGIDQFGTVRLMAVDPPMHGYPGTGDHGLEGMVTAIAGKAIPSGYQDMRASSDFFGGNRKKGIRGVMEQPLPGNVRFEPVFAQDGDTALDYTEGEMATLPDKLVELYRDGTRVQGSAQFMNFYNGLRTSLPYFDLQIALRGMKDDGHLDAEHVRRALLQAFPRFAGDHTTVVSSAPFLDYLQEHLH